MASPEKIRVSEEEYLATMTGEKPSLEYVNGEIFRKPLTKEPHLVLADEILAAFRHYRAKVGGMSGPEPTVDLSDGEDRRYRVPDTAYWGPGRERTGGVFVPPTALVEIRSEGQSLGELRTKCREYRAGGVDVCWLIDTQTRSVEVFDAKSDGAMLAPDTALETTAMPGFHLPLVELWDALGDEA